MNNNTLCLFRALVGKFIVMKKVFLILALFMTILIPLTEAGLEASSISSLAGDMDSFGTGLPPGELVRLADFRRDPTDGDFDMDPAVWCVQRIFTWNHVFELPANALITNATLTVVTFDVEDAGAGDGLGGGPFDTLLFLDDVEVPGAFDDTFTPDIGRFTPAAPNFTVFDLSPDFLGLLEDGVLQVLMNSQGGTRQDCIAIDYALLEIAITINVLVDIKPGSDPNCFNNNGHGVIPVAILGEPDFNVRDIDPETVALEGMEVKAVGKSDKLLAHYEDVNYDGYEDLVVQILDNDGVFQAGDTTAVLTGNLFDGTPIEGSDFICIVP